MDNFLVSNKKMSYKVIIFSYLLNQPKTKKLLFPLRTSWRRSRKNTKTRMKRTESWWCSCLGWDGRAGGRKFSSWTATRAEWNDSGWLFVLLSRPALPRRRRTRGRKARRGRGKTSPSRGRPLRSNVSRRPRPRGRSMRAEGRTLRREQKRAELRSRRRRCGARSQIHRFVLWCSFNGSSIVWLCRTMMSTRTTLERR